MSVVSGLLDDEYCCYTGYKIRQANIKFYNVSVINLLLGTEDRFGLKLHPVPIYSTLLQSMIVNKVVCEIKVRYYFSLKNESMLIQNKSRANTISRIIIKLN